MNKTYTVQDFMAEAVKLMTSNGYSEDFKNAICELVAGKKDSEKLDVNLRGYALAAKDKMTEMAMHLN